MNRTSRYKLIQVLMVSEKRTGVVMFSNGSVFSKGVFRVSVCSS